MVSCTGLVGKSLDTIDRSASFHCSQYGLMFLKDLSKSGFDKAGLHAEKADTSPLTGFAFFTEFKCRTQVEQRNCILWMKRLIHLIFYLDYYRITSIAYYQHDGLRLLRTGNENYPLQVKKIIPYKVKKLSPTI